MAKYAPIIVFAFNRLDTLKRTISSLLSNEEARSSDLYVFVDGPRPNKPGEEDKVRKVREFVSSIKGFTSLHYFFSDENRGLGLSVIRGVSAIINQYGNTIVVEDDLVVARNFLAFMNEGLNLYREVEKVFSICGYTNRVKVPDGYGYDAYFCTRSSSWGWATWADRWNSVDWDLQSWEQYHLKARAFNRWGGSDCWKMLRDWHNGRNNSWAIRFCFAQFLQGKFSLFPTVSKVGNNGFDGEGTNCKKWSRFKYDFDESGSKSFTYPEKVKMDNRLYRLAMRYNSVSVRILSRLMYVIK